MPQIGVKKNVGFTTRLKKKPHYQCLCRQKGYWSGAWRLTRGQAPFLQALPGDARAVKETGGYFIALAGEN